MKTLVKMQHYYQHRDIAVRQWKENGGKVVGYLCNMVPEEIIMAAGFFPFRISGDPHSGTEIADKYTEPSYEPDVRSILNLFLSGRYNFLDYVIIPHSRDAVYKLYTHIQRICEIEPKIKTPEIYFFDLGHTKFWLSVAYARERFLELKKKLEKWAGKKISKKALSKAIEITNSNRILLKSVKELREVQSPLLSGTEAMQIIGSSMFMLKEEHNKLLSQLLKDYDRLPVRIGSRIFVSGSPLDNLQFYEVIESLNINIVAEDNCWGDRYFESTIETAMDPIEAILDKYYIKALCPQMYPPSPRLEYVVNSALQAKVDGVIFYFLEWDNAALWELPELEKLLQAKGIATLCLTMQPYLLSDSDKKRLKISVEQFIGNLK